MLFKVLKVYSVLRLVDGCQPITLKTYKIDNLRVISESDKKERRKL